MVEISTSIVDCYSIKANLVHFYNGEERTNRNYMDKSRGFLILRRQILIFVLLSLRSNQTHFDIAETKKELLEYEPY